MVTHASVLSLPVDCKGMCSVSKLLYDRSTICLKVPKNIMKNLKHSSGEHNYTNKQANEACEYFSF